MEANKNVESLKKHAQEMELQLTYPALLHCILAGRSVPVHG